MTASTTNTSLSRSPGLDTLRAIAVLSVMMFHLGGYMPPAMYPATRYGWAGVDLFFVLSGYLIGSQLLRPIRDGKMLRFGEFYRKRAYRILPAYFTVLAIYYLWPAWRDGNGLSPVWEFVTFTVNLFIKYPENNSFSHVWSLCVEEHFYLLLPLLVFILSRNPSLGKTTIVLLIVLLSGIALRYWFLIHTLRPVASQHLPFVIAYIKRIYYPTYSHLDGLLAGVSLSLIEIFRPLWWQALSRYVNWLALLGVLITGFTLFLFRDRFVSPYGAAGVSTVIGFPLLSLGLAMLVGIAAMPGNQLSTLFIPGARPLATIAFSLYLTHKEVGNVLYHYFPNFMDKHPGEGTLLLLPLCVVVGGFLYFSVERPFLWLRDRRSRKAPTPNLDARSEPGL